MKYDPLRPVDPEAWEALDEDEKVIYVKEYHRRRHIDLPNQQVHALFHVIVENQVAMGDSFPAKATLERLMSEGLHRHEAIHALGTVLSYEVFDVLKEQRPSNPADYERKLKKLTARSWRRMGGS